MQLERRFHTGFRARITCGILGVRHSSMAEDRKAAEVLRQVHDTSKRLRKRYYAAGQVTACRMLCTRVAHIPWAEFGRAQPRDVPRHPDF